MTKSADKTYFKNIFLFQVVHLMIYLLIVIQNYIECLRNQDRETATRGQKSLPSLSFLFQCGSFYIFKKQDLEQDQTAEDAGMEKEVK